MKKYLQTLIAALIVTILSFTAHPPLIAIAAEVLVAPVVVAPVITGGSITGVSVGGVTQSASAPTLVGQACVSTSTSACEWTSVGTVSGVSDSFTTITGAATDNASLAAALNLRLLKSADLSDVASAVVARSNLGLGTAATTAATAYDPAGTGTTAVASAVAVSAQRASNLSDLANAATARTNLGLGTAATTAATAYDAAGAASSVQAVAAQRASNLSDLASASTARTNLGLGTAATSAVGDFTPTTLTTKGDVLGFGTVPARIPVGANGTSLVADSTVALGVKWAAPAGGGDALTTMPLSQFAATTSAQLAGVISNETGSNLLVFNTSPTIAGATITGVTSQTTSGDTNISGTDPSIFRQGNCSICLSGDMFTVAGEAVMRYWSHNFPHTVTGTVSTFGVRDETGVSELWMLTESGKMKYYSVATGLAGVAPTPGQFTLQETIDFTSGSHNFANIVDASGAVSTMPVKVGTVASLPGTCSTGMVYFATNATAGQNLYFCTATNTWTQQLNSGGGGGDMVLASVQVVTGKKTFDSSAIAIKGSSTGVTTFTSANAGASNYTQTFPAATGTVALTSDLTAANTSVTTGNVTQSTNLDTAVTNLNLTVTAERITGFDSWGGAGDYYSITTNQLTLLRGGTGYIRGKRIDFAGSQTASAFTPYASHWIYIDTNGAIGIATTRTHALYADNIILFEVYYDGVGYEVVWENHPSAFDADVEEYIHETVGTILTPVEGSNVVGADIARVGTGTGGVAADRQLKIVGTADINDGGIATNLPDSAGAAISWRFYYTDGSGQWVEYGTGTEMPMFYNAAGTMTAIGTGGPSDHAIWTLYAVKGEPNAGTPIYVAVADTTRYGTDTAALAAISAGLNAQATGTLFNALEPAQLGHAIVTTLSSTYVAVANISKATLRSATSVGGASVAASITTNTAGFSGGLSASDSNVQLALESLDKLERKGADIVAAATTDLSTTTGGYVHVTGNTTITSFGTHTAGHLHQLVFDGAPLITHNGTSLILPGGANIQAAAGDTMIVRSEGGSNWRAMTYSPAAVTGTGAAVRATSPTFVTPTLGAAIATSINGNTITTGTGTLTLGAGSTLATSATNSITLTSSGATNVTLPTTGTLATLGGADTLTNKTLTTPAVTWAEVNLGATRSLTASEVSSTVVNNYNQTTTAVYTLPTAAPGYNFLFNVSSGVVGTAKFAPATGEKFYFDSGAALTAGSGVISANPLTVGDSIAFSTFRIGAAAWAWLVKTVRGTAWTAN